MIFTLRLNRFVPRLAGLPSAFAAVFCMAVSTAACAAPPAIPESQFATPELVAAAKREGQFTFYTSSWVENEQEIIKAFNQRYPTIKIELMRASGGQLLTRVQSEAAVGRLGADLVDLDGRVSALKVKSLFADYAPPNAKDYDASDVVEGKFWPRSVFGWAIGYNKALITDPPKSWRELAYGQYGSKIGHVLVTTGASGWLLADFQRKQVAPDFWERLAAQKPVIFTTAPQTSSALLRGEVQIAPVFTNGLIPLTRQGAPLGIVLPPEGIPVSINAIGIPLTATHPNAAKLFLNWALSAEGQDVWVHDQGGVSLRKGSALPAGVDPKVVRLWKQPAETSPDFRVKSLKEWSALFGGS
jgi:iron(III) transport system substrate-binding protein